MLMMMHPKNKPERILDIFLKEGGGEYLGSFESTENERERQRKRERPRDMDGCVCGNQAQLSRVIINIIPRRIVFYISMYCI